MPTVLSDSALTFLNKRYTRWQSIGQLSAGIHVSVTAALPTSLFILVVFWLGGDVINHNFGFISLQISVLVSALAAILLDTSGTRMRQIPLFPVEESQLNSLSDCCV